MSARVKRNVFIEYEIRDARHLEYAVLRQSRVPFARFVSLSPSSLSPLSLSLSLYVSLSISSFLGLFAARCSRRDASLSVIDLAFRADVRR